MPERKLTIVVGIDDDRVNSIEDLEREILAQNICGQAARKYLDSLQDDMAQQVEIRKGCWQVAIDARLNRAACCWLQAGHRWDYGCDYGCYERCGVH